MTDTPTPDDPLTRARNWNEQDWPGQLIVDLVAEVERLRAENTALGVRWQEQYDRAERLEAAAAAFTLDGLLLKYEHSDGEVCAVKVTCPAAREALDVLLADAARPTEDQPRMMQGIWPAPAEGRTVALDAEADAARPTPEEE